MATSATMAAAGSGTLTTTPGSTPSSTPCCPKCGYGADLPPFDETQTALLNAQRQIADLQAQVTLLNQKATAAVDRLADYEDELAKLRAELDARPKTPTPPPPLHQATASTKHQHHPSLPTPPRSAAGLPTPSPSRASFLTTTAATRISALLSRKSPPPPPPVVPSLKPGLPSSAPSLLLSSSSSRSTPPPTPAAPTPLSPPPSLPSSSHLTTEDLLAALSREQSLRLQAEGRLNETSREIEELSASLFEQANEMVASERRARAKLEERVGELERRDGEKRKRLERLERAVGRVERVRAVLAEGNFDKSG
ncbi:hypothetical protein VTI74DRAFT_4032 [Chaetomium olivicolor]